VPAAHYFAEATLRRGPESVNVFVYGPPHLFRVAWLAGARDYLRDPWTVEELYLRLRGPCPPSVEWALQGRTFRLEGRYLAESEGGKARLSQAEAELLRLLVQRRGTAVSRAVLGWCAACSEGRVVDTLVGRVRRKLSLLGAQESVISVRGLGYRLP
jgi:DNA-binding response OmpR family regulator